MAKRNRFGLPIDADGYAPSLFPDTLDTCFYAHDRYTSCGEGELVRHEVFFNRKDHGLQELSKNYGAWLYLCPVHYGHIRNYPQMHRALEKETQQRMMDRYGWSLGDFMRVFGKDYQAKNEDAAPEEEDEL